MAVSISLGGREESVEMLEAAKIELDNIRLLCQQVEAPPRDRAYIKRRIRRGGSAMAAVI
jgi:hypothetical protein